MWRLQRKKTEHGFWYDKFINKSFNILNEINNKGYLTTIRSTKLSNELFETLKIIENYTDCKDNTGKFNLDKFRCLLLTKN